MLKCALHVKNKESQSKKYNYQRKFENELENRRESEKKP